MNPTRITTRTLVGAAVLSVLAALSSTTHATPVSSWTKSAGSTAITGLDTANPVFGNGTANSANGYQIYATLPETYTLSAVGDTLTFSGSVALTIAGDSGADQFRFGLFNTHSSSTTNGWLGYFATNSGTGANPNGRLWERTATNTTAYFNNGAGMADERQAFAGTPAGKFGSGNYTFSFALERIETGLSVTWSITGTGSTTYSIGGTYKDATPLTWSFDRVGLMSGGGLNASLASFSGINATYTPATPVPEPATWASLAALLTLGIAFIARRQFSRR
ncbi:PEP-CTERM sorting domain-containing protein [Geminisphaera colitermitum]|uniref:PEP-CTERM sorting domain-containing protein n=1 Tax=Geminisphaera colitermitum TaxID=1148786 RepID=UPI0005BCB9DE|nr:PEP-CTERM sorting domain-containing protein [Geminisphaera colitermitum]